VDNKRTDTGFGFEPPPQIYLTCGEITPTRLARTKIRARRVPGIFWAPWRYHGYHRTNMHSQPSQTTGVSPSSHNPPDCSTGTDHPPSPSVEDGRTCPNCGASVETVDTSEAVCRDCQIVVTAEPVSTAPRPRYGESETEKIRTGSRVTLLYADRGLGAGIDAGATTDGQGAPLTADQRRIFRDKGWKKHLRSQDFRLDYALSEIRRIGAELNIPTSELECAAHLYREALAESHIEGRSVDGFVAACLLAAIRQSSLTLPVSIREIQAASRATREQVRTARGVLELRLDVEIPPMKPRDFLPQAVSRLAAPHRVEMCARKLLVARRSDEEATGSLSPRTLAAAALHAAFSLTHSDDSPSLTELSDIMGVAESTISERKSHLLRYRDVWGHSGEGESK
jgi:transcription initiation factor TFIIB